MKEINEEWQMKIFDLLEGNLSPAEKQKITDAIENDPALLNEYKLMAQTYLQPENDIVFVGKSDLYRKTGALSLWVSYRWYAAAAAVSLLLIGTTLYIGNDNTINKNVVFSPITESNKETVTPNPEPKSSIELAPNYPTSKIQSTIVKVMNQSPELLIVNAPKPEIQDTIRRIIVAYNNPIVPKVEAIDSSFDYTTPEIIVQDASNGPLSSNKKRSLTYRLLNSSRKMLANLELPDVSFKATSKHNGKFPTIKMQIKTTDENVIATIIE
jgi:hypothetical protein